MPRSVEIVKVKGRKETRYSPETLLRAWRKYRKIKDEHKEPELSAGLVIYVPRPEVYTEFSFLTYLKISRSTWKQYKERKSFVYVIEEILHDIENSKETAYLNGRGSTRALERDLKLHYGWVDPLPAALPVGQLNINALSPEELRTAIEIQFKLLENGST